MPSEKNNGKSNGNCPGLKAVPHANPRLTATATAQQKQLPFGDDNQRDNSKSKNSGKSKGKAATAEMPHAWDGVGHGWWVG
jgi:hypothetical protein